VTSILGLILSQEEYFAQESVSELRKQTEQLQGFNIHIVTLPIQVRGGADDR
jgi:hypothetical protein